jgi:hypothetical protein
MATFWRIDIDGDGPPISVEADECGMRHLMVKGRRVARLSIRGHYYSSKGKALGERLRCREVCVERARQQLATDEQRLTTAREALEEELRVSMRPERKGGS